VDNFRRRGVVCVGSDHDIANGARLGLGYLACTSVEAFDCDGEVRHPLARAEDPLDTHVTVAARDEFRHRLGAL
jgi:hypothetical protein